MQSTKSPYKPKFLKLKQCKLRMEEDKNNKIREENKQLFYKIINAEVKPSLYSKIYKPKDSPSFDKNVMYFKRVKKELKIYEDNKRINKKLEKVKSFYENKFLTQRNRDIDNNIKRLQKSILELQPSLLYPSKAAKKQFQKYKHLNFKISQTKRCNSCCNRDSSKLISNKKKNINNKEKDAIKNSPTTSKDSSTLNKFSSLNDILSGKNNTNKDNSKIIEKNLNNLKETIKKIKEKEIKDSKNEKNKNEGKKLNLSFGKNNSKNNNIDNDFIGKEKPKTKKIKFGLKRNSSEVNIFN